MQINFKITFSNRLLFVNLSFQKALKRGGAFIAVITVLFTFVISGKNPDWIDLFAPLIVIPSTIILLVYLIHLSTLLIPKKNVEKTIEVNKDGLEIFEEGNLSKTYPWNTISSVNSTEKIIYFQLVTRSYIFIPKTYLSKNEITEFITESRDYLERTFEWELHNQLIKAKNKPPYWLGFFCLIPIIGAFVGLTMIVNGIIKYKNIRLIVMGVAGMAFTVVIYSLQTSLFNSEKERSGFKPFVQSDLTKLIKEAEFYKVQYGNFPDSLPQLKKTDDFLSINDPIQVNRNTRYFYKKKDNNYYLFSIGLDGVPFTQDDIYPTIEKGNHFKFGLIPKK